MKIEALVSKVVEVTWLDADGESGWSEYDDDGQKITYLKSYGLLVDKGKNFVVIAECKGSGNNWSSIQRIPNQMVKRVRVIESL